MAARRVIHIGQVGSAFSSHHLVGKELLLPSFCHRLSGLEATSSAERSGRVFGRETQGVAALMGTARLGQSTPEEAKEQSLSQAPADNVKGIGRVPWSRNTWTLSQHQDNCFGFFD